MHNGLAAKGDARALAAFDALINSADSGGQDMPGAQPAPSRRQLDPGRFARDFAHYERQRSAAAAAGFALEPGRSDEELELLAELGELYDGCRLGQLFRGRLAEMVSAMNGPQDLYFVCRALRHIPQWALESTEERDERLNATAGVRVEDTRAARKQAREEGRREAAEVSASGNAPQLPAAPLLAEAVSTAPVASALQASADQAAAPQQEAQLNRAQRRRLDALLRKLK